MAPFIFQKTFLHNYKDLTINTSLVISAYLFPTVKLRYQFLFHALILSISVIIYKIITLFAFIFVSEQV